MKICYIITKADEIGGAQVHVRDLSIAMLKKGCDILVITGEDGALVKQLKDNDIKVIIDNNLKRELNFFYDIKAFFSLRYKINKFSPDIIGLHSSKAGIIGRLAARSLSIPSVFTVHGWAFADGVSKNKKRIYVLIEKIFAKFFSDKLITVSYQDKELALKNSVSKCIDMVPIHNGVIDKYENVFFKRTNNIVNLIMVARFSEQKDHLTLFKALKNIDKQKWKLSLVGKGPLLDNLKKLANEYGLQENISFLGERDDVPQLLLSADIFLLISNWEGYPLSILEAMSAGLPCICSDVGGVNEAIINNKNGYLIQRNDYLSLREKINLLIKNRNEREIMGIVSRDSYLKYHTLDKMVDDTFRIYSDLLKG